MSASKMKMAEYITHIATALAISGVHMLASTLVAHDFVILEWNAIVSRWIKLVQRVDVVLSRPLHYNQHPFAGSDVPRLT